MTSNKRHRKPDIPSLAEAIPTDEVGDRVIDAEVEEVIAEEDGEFWVEVRDEKFTAHDCITDIRDLAEQFPDRRITRDFYRKQGGVPEAAWTGHFGNFPEFLRQAKLEHTRNANKIRNLVARHAAVDELRVISERRMNYDNLYARPNANRFKTMVACSDLHDKECDPFYLRVLTNTVKDIQPDVVCLDGDIFDLPEFGRYTNDPREWDIVGRMGAGKDIMRQLREVAPEAQIDFIEGNHEARVVRHLLECSPAVRAVLSGVHDFDLRRLFGLDEFEINYVANADLFTFTDAQVRKEVVKNYKMYWGCLLAHHFPIGKKYGMPGFNGHHHKHIVWSEHNAMYGSYEWHQMGAGHIREASYCDGSKWNNGFLVASVDTKTKSVVFDYTYVGDTFAVSAGKYYTREESEFYPALTKELDLRADHR